MKILFILFTVITFACNNSTSGDNQQTDITQHPDYRAGFDLVTASKCSTCHLLDSRLTGPSYREIAERYAPANEAIVADLAMKVLKGGMGNWGEIYMTPNSNISLDEAKAMVKYILLLKPKK